MERLKSSGWQIVPSRANFIFARHPEVSGKEVYLKLKERGILVRYFGHAGIEDYLRISIGTDEEMEQLSRNLEEILQR